MSLASILYLFVQMEGRATTRVRLKIRGAAAKLFVLWRRAANRTILVSLGAELGELVATLPRRVLSDAFEIAIVNSDCGGARLGTSQTPRALGGSGFVGGLEGLG